MDCWVSGWVKLQILVPAFLREGRTQVDSDDEPMVSVGDAPCRSQSLHAGRPGPFACAVPIGCATPGVHADSLDTSAALPTFPVDVDVVDMTAVDTDEEVVSEEPRGFVTVCTHRAKRRLIHRGGESVAATGVDSIPMRVNRFLPLTGEIECEFPLSSQDDGLLRTLEFDLTRQDTEVDRTAVDSDVDVASTAIDSDVGQVPIPRHNRFSPLAEIDDEPLSDRRSLVLTSSTVLSGPPPVPPQCSRRMPL